MPEACQILVANLGSTSFKFRLFEMPSELLLAKGGFERIGSGRTPWKIRIGDSPEKSGEGNVASYEDAIRLVEKTLGGFGDLAAVGFKPVMARGISGTQFLDGRVLDAMEEISSLLPAHNPPYIAGVRLFNKLYPTLPCIGTFETAFYDHVPARNRRFPIPLEWEKNYGIARYGFHGASHCYVSERCAELKGTDQLRLVSCHLGGSSSMAAVSDGRAVNSSWGMTPQSGLPQNNRAGDFDCFAMMYLARECGLGWDAVEKALASDAGLKGMSGLPTGDMRDLREAANAGNKDARLAIDVYVAAIRKYLGQFYLELNGLDVLIFTAGIGENNPDLRAEICADLDCLGLKLDKAANNACRASEAVISAPDSKVEVRVIPTNEEIVIARNAWRLLEKNSQKKAA
jgi:acetate kinase